MVERTGRTGVQSLARALTVIDAVTDAGGRMTVHEIAEATTLPQATVHRLLQTLIEHSYMRQLPDRSYTLGFRLIPLGTAASRLIGAGTEHVLRELARELGETANLAILTGDSAEYVAQAPSRHTVRMFTEVGRKVDLHATGVGKTLLAQLDDSEVAAIIGRTGLAPHTKYTITTETDMRAALAVIREHGYATDQEEQELGVRCVAVAVPSLLPVHAALSISGPLSRVDNQLIARAVPLLRSAAQRLTQN